MMASGRSKLAASGLVWFLLITAVSVIPCLVATSGKDAMRIPKDVAFLTLGLMIGVGAAIAFSLCRLFPTTVRLRTVPTIAFAAVVWTGIVYFSSTNRAISAESFVWVLCAAIFASSVDWL